MFVQDEAQSVPGGPAIDAGPARRDDLVGCLLFLARTHGRVLTRDAALAGLPLGAEGLPPSIFARAALRAGLTSRIVARPLEELDSALFPVVLLMADARACVLLGWTADRQARVVFPELDEAEVELSHDDLARRYIGHAIYVRPKVQFDGRAPRIGRSGEGHWFWSRIAENRSLYRDVLLAALLINVFALGLPLFIMNVYDRVVPNNATDTLWVLAAGVAIVLVGDFALRILRGHFVDLAGSRADVKISAHIMERVLGMRMEQRPPSAGAFAANLRAFESVRDFISSATVVALVDLPFALLFLGVIAWIAPTLVLPFAAGIIILLLYAVSIQGRMKTLAETTYRAGAQRNATLVEGLVGLETLKALGAEAPIQRKWEQSAALLSRVSAQLRLLAAAASQGTNLAQQLVSVVIIVIGVYLIGAGELSMGGLIACYMLSSRAMAPFGQLASLLTQYHNAATALTSLDEVMAREVERPEGSNFISRGNLRGDIEFRDVSFRYPGQGTEALRNVSVRIRAGERVAVLGRVGSGKSTLEKLILGLYRPTTGAVLIDGVDQRQLDPAELRRHIGYVGQDAMLFYGSLRDNITLAAPFAEDADIVRAAELAGILEFVNAHPEGFDMLVGERGESLSGGQRQGVALARAFIHAPPILLLDEPSAAMDHSSEEDLKRRLKRFAEGRTLLVVTHRTSLLDLVDRIIVVDGGRIVADGPKAQVVEALRQGRIGRAL
jgi:ATP-binding cassette subfamily C protein LapB